MTCWVPLVLGVISGCGGIPDGIAAQSVSPDIYRSGEVFELTPPILLPTQVNGASRTRIYIGVPEGAQIGLDEQGELSFPTGTRADRVEETRVKGRWRIADVRGETLDANGSRFHLLRPDDEGSLSGFAWDRNRGDLDTLAHETIAARLREGHGHSGDTSGSRRDAMANGLMARSGCVRCHEAHEPEGSAALSPVKRGTDGHGWYVPRYVMRDEAPLETYRPDDPNEGRFVSVRCGDKAARRVERAGGRRWVCPGGETPVGRFDLVGALAAGDAHGNAVCESRRWLWSRMTEVAKAKFDAAVEVCRRADTPE